MYDANGTMTTSTSDASTYVYHAWANKLLTGPSTTNIIVTRSTDA